VKKIPVFEIQSRAFTSSRDGIHIQHVIYFIARDAHLVLCFVTFYMRQ